MDFFVSQERNTNHHWKTLGRSGNWALKFKTIKVFFVHPDVHWLPLKAQIYFAGLLPQTEIRASKLEQRHICLLRGRKKNVFGELPPHTAVSV